MNIKSKVEKAIENLRNFGIYNLQDFYSAEMVQLGILSTDYEEKILDHIHNGDFDSISYMIAKSCGFNIDDGEEFYITLNRHLFRHFNTLIEYKKYFVIDGKNYLDYIMESYEKKFFVDFKNLKDWFSEFEEQVTEFNNTFSISHASTNLLFQGHYKLKKMFDYIDICVPEVPRFYFDADNECMMLSFSIQGAANLITSTDFNWKEFFKNYFNVSESAWRKENEGWDSLIFLYAPYSNWPEIIFNGENYCFQWEKFLNTIDGAKFYADIENFTKYYELRFHHTFYLVTNSTVLEWYKETTEEDELELSEPCIKEFENYEERLKRLHRLIVTDTWENQEK